MKRALIFIFLLISLQPVVADGDRTCTHWPAWSAHACHRLHQIWKEGDTELYVTGYSWHNRYSYPKEKLSRYNELAWGGGLGKGFYDEDGDWHGISAFAFLDSHKNLEPVVGYAFLKIAHLNENTRVGAGYSVLITQRRDILHGIPFPGALPWLSFNYRKVALFATYIPGSRGEIGNVVFLFAKWTI